MRAPLAFLLGKLNFEKEFQNLQGGRRGPTRASRPNPKATACLIPQVEFLVTSDCHIREVKVTGFDKSIMDFTFDQERLDPQAG